MSEFKEVYVNNLPDTYRKDTDSNNYKILNISEPEISGVKKDIKDIYDSLDIEQATGKTLDLYGEMIGQARGYATDDQYRLLIKSRITRNLMNGDHGSLIRASCLIFGCNPNEIQIIEDTTPATIKIISLPYSVINHVGLSASQVVQLIMELVPVGIKVGSAELQGTFEFAETDSVYDETKGFSDNEDEALQTMGGYLGFLYSDDNEQPLPF